MSQSKAKKVVIIGAGLSGLSLALALHANSIKCAVYELRTRSFIEGGGIYEGGGIILSPNALRIFDDLGLYKQILPESYVFDKLTFKNGDGETTGHYPMGNERLYRYRGIRVRRHVVLNKLLAMLHERGVLIQFEKKFSKVLEESEDVARFEFEDGAIGNADLLIGADRIHSSIRRYVCPNNPPRYNGFLALASYISTSKLRLPYPDYPLPLSISAKPGFFLLLPQNANAGEVLVGTQHLYPEQTRAGWETLLADKAKLYEIIYRDYSAWPDIVKSAFDALVPAEMNIWPYYTMLHLDNWVLTS